VTASLDPRFFKVADPLGLGVGRPSAGGVDIVTVARALQGMQKEALVSDRSTGTAWRMVSDEGPYLNGTDLAPFPLAFFSTGVVGSFAAGILARARARRLSVDGLELILDSFYTMEGSALAGTMTGGALPAELSVKAPSASRRDEILRLAQDAVAVSPAEALYRTRLDSRFTLRHNGKPIRLSLVAEARDEPPPDPGPAFRQATPAGPGEYAPDIMAKVEGAEALHGVPGGAGSSLQAEQKRTLHVRARGVPREDGLTEVTVRLLKPIGSAFRFLSDDPPRLGGSSRAPDPLAYLSAGVAFCYLTQIGRYTQIVKHRLDTCRLVQHTQFGPGTPPAPAPVRTHVYVQTPEPEDRAERWVKMGEQTCFLHATCRSSLATVVRLGE
jgi:uncharacterized OsmC-like protein